ncbi:MAG: DUF3846 domain-containing protein [Clostridia bacterium]|nr:DUF3846 domain-containing protein [Clostridia bacterium]
MLTIAVLVVEPGERPRKEIIFNSLEDFKIIVNDVTPFPSDAEFVELEENVVLVRNEEGVLLSLEGNRRLGNEIIAGTFFIAGMDNDGNITSLPDDKIEKYRKCFWEIEKFTDKEVSDAYWNMWFQASDDIFV